MSELKSLIIPFLLGGTLISGVKFAATHMDNPALAAILGGIPVGLTAIFFLTSDKSIGYSHDYFYVTLSLATAILVFYMLRVHTDISKNVVLLIAFGCWASLVALKYFLSERK